jgi:DNA damage-binding protein 1
MAHDAKMGSEEMHQSEGGFLKPIIFGGLDGILTSFAIVAGSAGGNLSTGVILILGFSNIFADALSMGVGEFLSSKAENEWILSERRREEWEFENYPEGEVREMVEIFEERGMSNEDATIVITTMAKYKDFFVDIMMTQELQLQVPETDHVRESFNEGACTSCFGMCFCHALQPLAQLFFAAQALSCFYHSQPSARFRSSDM